MSKHVLAVTPGQSMSVTLADGSNVEASEIYIVPLVLSSDTGHVVSCIVEYRVLSCLITM